MGNGTCARALTFSEFLPFQCGKPIGIGLALPIENQMLHPESFKMVWTCGMLLVTVTYVAFGAFCYSCYGDEVFPCPPLFLNCRLLACVRSRVHMHTYIHTYIPTYMRMYIHA